MALDLDRYGDGLHDDCYGYPNESAQTRNLSGILHNYSPQYRKVAVTERLDELNGDHHNWLGRFSALKLKKLLAQVNDRMK